ncbi:MAG: prolyl oligopeptidase family serine peptidase [Steroidobacteraceae bacterium]
MRAIFLLAMSALFAQSPAMASISSAMIVQMRDITSVSVSPNGELAVVGICYPNLRTNKREPSWVIVPLHGGGAPKTVSGGEEIYDPSAPGAFLSRQALWSRDGKWFFYLRRDGEEVQLWETRSDGSESRQVTHSASDLIDLKRSSDPDVFIVQLAPARAVLRKAEEDEYREGILYDDHIIGEGPLTRTEPVIDRLRSLRIQTDEGTKKGGWTVPGWTGTTSAAFDVPRRELKTSVETIPSAYDASLNGSNRIKVVPLEPMTKDPYDYGGKYTLQLQPTIEGGPTRNCEIAQCIANRITLLGWSQEGAEIYYLADSIGGALSTGSPMSAGIYAWNPRSNVVRLIHDTAREGTWGKLYDLRGFGGLTFEPGPIAGREIVAAFTAADQPPRLESIDLDTGVSHILFDPNAELRSLTRGRTAFHAWDTSIGYSGRGIMVVPDDYRPGERYPAVISSYSCGDGLLHGGGGDGAPEFVLAHQGYVAVCVDIRVREILARETDVARIYPIICGIVSGLIVDLTQEGMIDPARVGLTGQSLGANAGAYCISHSGDIAAAAFRHGSAIERERYELFDTSAWSRGPTGPYAWMHLPDPRKGPGGRWDQLSVASRAQYINTPTLIQEDSGEYQGALPLWSAMRDAGKPIEMYVFPDEGHSLIQPIHRLVNYERQLDWFNFWLKHEQSPMASKRGQYARWDRLRELTRRPTPEP